MSAALDPLIVGIADAVVDRLRRTIGTPDELIAVADCAIERRAALRLIRSGELPARRIGRRWYCRRSDLLRLVDRPPAAPASGARLAARAARRAAP